MNEKKTYNEKQKAEAIIDSLFSGDLPAELEEDIRLWLTEDEGSDAKTEALESVFMRSVREVELPAQSTVDSLREMKNRLGLPAPLAADARPALRGRHSLRRTMMRVAAVVIPVLVVAGVLFMRADKDTPVDGGEHTEWLTLEAGGDADENIRLADGSQITLQPGAVMSYPESFGATRNVKVEGQAFFSVERDEAAPFVVEANEVTITVLGTEFEVVADESGLTRVALYSGSVRVDAAGHSATLVPGQVCEYDKAERLLRVSDAAAEVTGYRGLDFNMATLGEMLSVVAERYGVELVVNGRLSDVRYTIRFDGSEDMTVVLETIKRLAGDFEYNIEEAYIYITPNN